MKKKIKGSLFIKIFIITYILIGICCFITYTMISWILPKTYSTSLDTELNGNVTTFISEIEELEPLESGKAFDEFLINHKDVLMQLFDRDGNELELPSRSSGKFPVLLSGGAAAESADPTAYRASHSYFVSFADTADTYVLLVAGSANEVHLLKNTLGTVFCILSVVIFLIALIASIIYSYYVTKPVLHLCKSSEKISELDFSKKCEENRTDELGTLAHSLNAMSEKLSVTIKNLNEANAQLKVDIEHERELEQAQLEFFSAVSHELKTPLTILKGQTEGMVLKVGTYQNRDKYLSRSLEIINTMQNMVQEILTVSRIKSSKSDIKKETICFSDLLSREYGKFEDLVVQKRLNWNEKIVPDLQIEGDVLLIEKAIANLISNAILYSPEESSIFLIAYKETGHVFFQLENTGIHIPEPEISKLFDAFYRVEHSRNRKTGGSGLGLYIVKTILEQHDATYQIQNTDQGVRFSIRF